MAQQIPTFGETGAPPVDLFHTMSIVDLNSQLQGLVNKMMVVTCRPIAAQNAALLPFKNYIGELTLEPAVPAAEGVPARGARYIITYSSRHNHLHNYFGLEKCASASESYELPSAGWDYSRIMCVAVYMGGCLQHMWDQGCAVAAQLTAANALIEAYKSKGISPNKDADDEPSDVPSLFSVQNWDKIQSEHDVESFLSRFILVIGQNKALSAAQSSKLNMLRMQMMCNISIENWTDGPQLAMTKMVLQEARVSFAGLSEKAQDQVRSHMMVPENDRLSKEIAKVAKADTAAAKPKKVVVKCFTCGKFGHKSDVCHSKNEGGAATVKK